MVETQIPHFIIKNKFQRRNDLYEDILTPEILEDVCYKITGQTNYTCYFDNSGYNKGRLAILNYGSRTAYVSFSENQIRSRNSSFQSFPTALVKYHQEPNLHKRICFYFLRSRANIETAYFTFMYRLMKTAGAEFLNADDNLSFNIIPFSTVEEIITDRNTNRGRNRANNSTFLTRSQENVLQIYGKTYGANKYETTLLTLALSNIAESKIELFQICEQNLRILPAPALQVIRDLGTVSVILTDMTLERREYEENDSLRSGSYIYNLLAKLGDKKCAFCECEIPQIIQGSHVWQVAEIKQADHFNQDQKLQSAVDGDNGLWLCQNHHKLFDLHLLRIFESGEVRFRSNIHQKTEEFIRDITTHNSISTEFITPKFEEYISRRNIPYTESIYSSF